LLDIPEEGGKIQENENVKCSVNAVGKRNTRQEVERWYAYPSMGHRAKGISFGGGGSCLTKKETCEKHTNSGGGGKPPGTST